MAKKKQKKKEYTPSVLAELLDKMSYMFMCIAIYGVYTTIFESSASEGMSMFLAGLLFFLPTKYIAKTIQFNHIKKYYHKKGVDELVRNDTGEMAFSIKVYNSLPGRRMEKYIRDLNPSAGEVVRVYAETNKKRKKK